MKQSIIFEDLTTKIRLSQMMIMPALINQAHGSTCRLFPLTSLAQCCLPSTSLLEEQQPPLFPKL